MAATKKSPLRAIPKYKIPPRRVPSDDYSVALDGTMFFPHEGEWIEIQPLQNLGRLMRLSDAWGRLSDREGNPTQAFEDICTELSQVIVGWNWTDNAGQPMPQPHNRPDVIKAVDSMELVYLYAKARNFELEENTKNA